MKATEAATVPDLRYFRKMKRALIAVFALASAGLAYPNAPEVPASLSPDGKIHAVVDIDRDRQLSPEGEGENPPNIEITLKATGQVLATIPYFGSVGDDARPLREHLRVSWRADSKAFAITIDDRFYSSSKVFALSEESKFIEVAFPTYEAMTGFPPPDSEHLRPRGRATVEGWDSEGCLIYDLFAVPLPSLKGNDPLIHRIFLNVSTDKMTPVKVEHEAGEWRHGDWIPSQAAVAH